MKKFLLFFLTLSPFGLFAQDDGLKVISFTQDLTDIAARSTPKYDTDGNYCALVKIQVLTEDKISFLGSFINGPVQKHANEYWVYMGQGAKKISISHPRYETLLVVFNDVSNGEIKTLEQGVTYRLVISVPEKEVDTVLVAETFDAKLKEAKKMYKAYASHNDSEYFRKAAGLYDAAMKHTDCPSSMLQTLQNEYDEMRFMRKYTFLYEKATRIASEKSTAYGYKSDSVYHYLTLAYKATLKLTQKYPDAQSFRQISKIAEQKMTQHPKGKITEKVVVTSKRLNAHGLVTIKKSTQPISTIGIYACRNEKPSKNDVKKLIGTVQQNGHYNVILPDGYNYIIFDGEKSAHYVTSEKSEINITL